jgi:translation initiation factor IF-3
VRLIGDDGAQLGVMSGRDALKAAQLKELDLVKIAPTANPPVCRIMDYGKFRFEQAKKDKEAKKRQHVVEIKEIRLSPGIDQHDFDFKVKNAQRFLADGDKVKVAVRFRGREMAHTSIGEQLMAKFAETCSEISSVEKPSKMEGRHMIMFLAPKTIKTP